jgi:hypothetical protein
MMIDTDLQLNSLTILLKAECCWELLPSILKQLLIDVQISPNRLSLFSQCSSDSQAVPWFPGHS